MNYEEEIRKLEALIEELKAEQEAKQEVPPVWKPDLGAEYYVVDADYVALPYPWRDDRTDIYLLKRGAVFKSEEEALNYDRALKLIETIRRERFKAQGHWYPSDDEVSYIIRWYRGGGSVNMGHTSWALSSDVFGLWRSAAALNYVTDKYDSELGWYFVDYLPSIN